MCLTCIILELHYISERARPIARVRWDDDVSARSGYYALTAGAAAVLAKFVMFLEYVLYGGARLPPIMSVQTFCLRKTR